MPSNATAKTKSAPKPTTYGFRATLRRNRKHVFLILGISLLPIVVWVLALLPGSGQPTYKLTIDAHPDLPKGQGRYGGVVVSQPWVYYLKGVSSEADLAKGLSGTEKLGFNQGMLFLFGNTAERCFWMKDMNYSLDIIWADSQKRITAVEQRVAPSTYPNSFCHNGRFVIEINAGEVDKNALKQGQLLNF